MRALALWVVLAACGRPDTVPPPSPHERAPASSRAPQPPGARLDDRAAPVAYDLTLELDPDRAQFTGHVAITIDVAAPGTSVVWLHAVELEIARATLTTAGHSEAMTVLDGGAQLRGLSVGHLIAGGPATLTLDYTGKVSDLTRRTGKDEEGLFRERAGGAWYVYSQAESVFARKIVPCFDEPRWKPAWRVTAIVPRGQLAVGNAPIAGERTLPDGRREVRFADIAPMASYVVAVAVGPFEAIELGKHGRGHLAIRALVGKGDGRRELALARYLPRIVDDLERYADAPLPLAKLDLVSVPVFFGAMENPGLIPYDRAILVGGNDIVLVTAHELAHQWLGNAVTPAWWDELWLSEALASWLGERVTRDLHEEPVPAIVHRARRDALAADELPGAQALVHPIATSEEVEPSFDAIAYNKGSAVITMFEQFANRDARGERTADDPFRAAVREYLAAHAGTAVTSRAFLDALAHTTSPALSAALASNLHHAGTPVVELGLRCTPGGAVLTASTRDDVSVPVCVRFPTHDHDKSTHRASTRCRSPPAARRGSSATTAAAATTTRAGAAASRWRRPRSRAPTSGSRAATTSRSRSPTASSRSPTRSASSPRSRSPTIRTSSSPRSRSPRRSTRGSPTPCARRGRRGSPRGSLIGSPAPRSRRPPRSTTRCARRCSRSPAAACRRRSSTPRSST